MTTFPTSTERGAIGRNRAYMRSLWSAPAPPPPRRTGPGALDPPAEALPVTPPATSQAPRYREPVQCLGLTPMDGDPGHICAAMISPKHGRLRCPKCVKEHEKRGFRIAKVAWRLRQKVAV